MSLHSEIFPELQLDESVTTTTPYCDLYRIVPLRVSHFLLSFSRRILFLTIYIVIYVLHVYRYFKILHMWISVLMFQCGCICVPVHIHIWWTKFCRNWFFMVQQEDNDSIFIFFFFKYISRDKWWKHLYWWNIIDDKMERSFYFLQVKFIYY